MAQALTFHRFTAVPSTWPANAVCFVRVNGVAETYVVDGNGNPYPATNTQAIATTVNTLLSDFNLVQVVDNIAARDDYVASASTKNLLFLVLDATADNRVSSGAAFYAYQEAQGGNPGVFHFISDFESQNLVLNWTNIQNKPDSTVSQIDDAVGKAHTHTNKAVLDGLSDSVGQLQYNGTAVGAVFSTTDW